MDKKDISSEKYTYGSEYMQKHLDELKEEYKYEEIPIDKVSLGDYIYHRIGDSPYTLENIFANIEEIKDDRIAFCACILCLQRGMQKQVAYLTGKFLFVDYCIKRINHEMAKK